MDNTADKMSGKAARPHETDSPKIVRAHETASPKTARVHETASPKSDAALSARPAATRSGHQLEQRPFCAVRESKRLTGVPASLVIAARKLFEERGTAGITITDIAQEAGVTRELFYYYFNNRAALVDAVIDDYVEDFLESVDLWNETRIFGDMRGSLASCIAAFRRVINEAKGPRPMVRVLEELGVRDVFVQRVVREAADYTMRCILPEYEHYHKVNIEHVREMICVTLYGVAGLIRMDPAVSDEVLMKVVEQTLRLDIT